MRAVVLLLLVVALPALADDGRSWSGAGFQVVATSPTISEVTFAGPAVAKVEIRARKPSGEAGGVLDQCKLPCRRIPKGSKWKSVVWRAVLPDGSEVARGVLQPKPQTGYEVMIARWDHDLNGAKEGANVHRSAGLDERMFEKCLKLVEMASPPATKLALNRSCITDTLISVVQLGKLVDQLPAPKDKMLVVRAGLEGLVDPEHEDELLQHFKDPAEKQQVQALLDGANEETEP